MIMLETILVILAAVITIFIAGLLVHKQEQHHKSIEELSIKTKESLEELVTEVAILTREEPAEYSLGYLERRMEIFTKTLDIVKKPTYIRRNKNVKRTKNPTND